MRFNFFAALSLVAALAAPAIAMGGAPVSSYAPNNTYCAACAARAAANGAPLGSAADSAARGYTPPFTLGLDVSSIVNHVPQNPMRFPAPSIQNGTSLDGKSWLAGGIDPNYGLQPWLMPHPDPAAELAPWIPMDMPAFGYGPITGTTAPASFSF